jgi:hypothetical protein
VQELDHSKETLDIDWRSVGEDKPREVRVQRRQPRYQLLVKLGGHWETNVGGYSGTH